MYYSLGNIFITLDAFSAEMEASWHHPGPNHVKLPWKEHVSDKKITQIATGEGWNQYIYM